MYCEAILLDLVSDSQVMKRIVHDTLLFVEVTIFVDVGQTNVDPS